MRYGLHKFDWNSPNTQINQIELQLWNANVFQAIAYGTFNFSNEIYEGKRNKKKSIDIDFTKIA